MNIQLPPKLKELLVKMNQNGIPLPMLRDCLTSSPSITYTLTFTASVLVILSICNVGSIDYTKAMSFLQVVGSGYLVRQTMKHVAPLDNKDNTGE